MKLYKNLKNVEAVECVLFIDPWNPFLWFSPDVLIGDKVVIEVRWFQSITRKVVENTE